MSSKKKGKEAGDEPEAEISEEVKRAPPPPAPEAHGDFGALLFRAVRARELRDTQTFGKQSPYVELAIGGEKAHRVRSSVVAKGGVECEWPADEPEQIVPVRQAVKDAVLRAWNSNPISDDEIGEVLLSLATFEKEKYEVSRLARWVKLHKGRKGCGEVQVHIQHIPPLIVDVIRAEHLEDVQKIGKQDPQCIVYYHGPLLDSDEGVRRTPVASDAGRSPIWNTECAFNVTTQHHLHLYKPGAPKPAADAYSEDEFFAFQVVNVNPLVNDNIGYGKVSVKQLVEDHEAGRETPVVLQRGKWDEKAWRKAAKKKKKEEKKEEKPAEAPPAVEAVKAKGEEGEEGGEEKKEEEEGGEQEKEQQEEKPEEEQAEAPTAQKKEEEEQGGDGANDDDGDVGRLFVRLFVPSLAEQVARRIQMV